MPAAVGFFSMIDPGDVVSPVAVRVGASGEVLVAPLLRIVPLAVASGTLPRWLFSADPVTMGFMGFTGSSGRLHALHANEAASAAAVKGRYCFISLLHALAAKRTPRIRLRRSAGVAP